MQEMDADMKILMCNSFYYLRGGSERYMFELIKLLEKHGHEVIPFSMEHVSNFPSDYSGYFVSHIDYPALLANKPGVMDVFKVVERLMVSSEAKEKLRQLIQETKPDIAHIHGIGHEISSTILGVIRSFQIPIVQTLHDYGLLCPNTNFVSRDKICERCKGGQYYNIALRRCKRNSLGASLLACVSQYMNLLTNVYENNVDVYISPSDFLHEKLREYGVKKKVEVIHNFIDLGDQPPNGEISDYCLFAGRLLPIKGVRTLIEAASLIGHARILIAGDGELSDEICKTVADRHLENVSLLGYMEQNQLMRLISHARFTIVPSECYENYPMSIIESFVCGKPVIASRIGALPELIQDGWNGLLFEPGNSVQLAEKIRYFFDHPEKAEEMGRNARESTLLNNDPEAHYQQILQIYQTLMNSPSLHVNG